MPLSRLGIVHDSSQYTYRRQLGLLEVSPQEEQVLITMLSSGHGAGFLGGRALRLGHLLGGSHFVVLFLVSGSGDSG